jgi:hypothetical protein
MTQTIRELPQRPEITELQVRRATLDDLPGAQATLEARLERFADPSSASFSASVQRMKTVTVRYA